MACVKELQRQDDTVRDTVPSDEEFVAAVIRVSERLHSNLRALACGVGWVKDPVDPREDSVIQAYSAAHGVPRPSEPCVSEANRR